MSVTYDRTVDSWQSPAEPVSGPLFDPRSVVLEVIHYRGAGKNPVPADIAQSLRASQHSYLTDPKRGYSLGYNAGVVSQLGHPDDGTTWEIRGTRYRCAANAPAGLNVKAFGLLVIQVDNAAPTPAAAAAIRRMGGELNRLCGRRLEIVGHGDTYGPPHGGTTPTACCGTGLRSAIADGLFDPDLEEDDDMKDLYVLWRHPSWANVFLIGPGGAVHMSDQLATRYRALGVPDVVEAHEHTLDGALHQCGMTRARLVPAGA